MKAVRKIQLRIVKPDGKAERKPTAIYLDVDKFAISVPEYAVQALGVNRHVYDEVQSKCVEKFERVMNDYEKWILAATCEPVIVLHAKLMSRDRRRGLREGRNRVRDDIDRDSFFLKNSGDFDVEQHVGVQVAYRHAFRVAGRIYSRREKHRDFDDRSPISYEVGTLDSWIDDDDVVLPHTPELEAQIARICEALDGAARTLAKICGAKDVGAALLSMTVPRLTGPSAPAALPRAKRGKR